MADENTKSVNAEEKGLSLDEIIHKIVYSAYGSLFVMNKETETSKLFVLFCLLVEFLQMLSFPLDQRLSVRFFWNTNVIGWLGEAGNAARIFDFVYFSTNNYHMLLPIVGGIICFALIIFLMLMIDFAYGNTKQSFSSSLLRMMVTAMSTFAFIPMCGSLILQVQCSAEKGATACGTTGHIVYAVIGVIVLVIFLAMCLFFATTLFNRLPTSNAVLARPSSRIQAATLLGKFILTVVFAVCRPTADRFAWLLIFVALAVTTALAFLYCYIMPYYRYSFNVGQACYLWVCAWACLCAALVQLVNIPTEQGLSVLFFLLSPCVAFSCYLYMQARRQSLIKLPIISLKSVTDCELKARFQLESVTDELRTAAANNIDTANWDDAKKQEHARIISEALDLLAYGAKRFPNAPMYLFRTHYTIAYTENRGLALNLLSRAEQRLPAIDEVFSIFYYRKQNEENFNTGDANTDVLSYIEFNDTLAAARREDEIASRFQGMFWEELTKSTSQMERLNELSATLNSSMVSAQESFRKLMKMNPNSVQVLRMYASFLLEIANEAQQGNKLLERANDLEEQRTKAHERGETNDALFDDRNALISISAELKNVGEILDINMMTVHMFGYSQSDMITRNVSMIMPSPFSTHHQAFLNHYLETGESTILNKSRVTFGAHRSGHLVPVDLFVREIASSDGNTFLAVLRRPSNLAMASALPMMILQSMQEEAAGDSATAGGDVAQELADKYSIAMSQHGELTNLQFAMSDMQGRVTAITTGITRMFGSTMEEVRANLVEVGSWFPQYSNADLLAKMREPAGLNCVAKTQIGDIHVNVCQALLKVGGDTAYLMHIAQRKDVGVELNRRRYVMSTGQHVATDESDDSQSGPDDSDDDDEDEEEGDEEEDEEEAKPLSQPGVNKLNLTGVNSSQVEMSELKQRNTASSQQPAAKLYQPGPAEPSSQPDAPSLQPKKTVTTKASDGGQKPKKALSQSSKSSGSTNHMSMSQLHAKLRTFANARQNRDLNEGIRNLRISLILVLVFVCAVSIFRFLYMSKMIDDFNMGLDSLFQSGTRRYLCVRIMLMAHVLLMGPLTDSNGYYWANFFSEAECARVRPIMLNDCATFEQINNLLYISRRAQLAPNHLALYTSRSSVTTYNIRDNSAYFTLQVSLWDASQSFLSMSRVYSQMRILDIIDTDPTVFYVLRNGIAFHNKEFFFTLNETCFFYQTDTLSSLAAMKSFALAILIAGILSIILVAFVFVQPKVVVVERNKEDVLYLFAKVPMKLINAFYAKSQRRLTNLRAAMNGEADTDADRDADVEEDPVVAATLALSNAAQKRAEREQRRAEEGDGVAKDDASKNVGANDLADDDDDDLGNGNDGNDGATHGDAALEAERKKKDEEGGVAACCFRCKETLYTTLGWEMFKSTDEAKTDRQSRASRRNAKKADRIEQNSSFIMRNITMIKIMVMVVLTIVYFSIMYAVEFGNLERRLNVAPPQVNWSQHRRLSLLMLVYDTRHILTQKFWKEAEAGASGIVDVQVSDFTNDLNLLGDIEVALAYGSTRFNVDPPTTDQTEQIGLMFKDVCYLGNNQGLKLEAGWKQNCTKFSHGILTHGLHAALLEYVNSARTSISVISAALDSSGKYNQSNYVWSNVTQALVFLNELLVPKFNHPAMKWMQDTCYINGAYLDVALQQSGNLYGSAVANYIQSQYQLRLVLLIVFILVSFFLYVGFYNPMCWQLDAEQKRTSAMLLLIPSDVMERIPSIREFVHKLEG